MNDQDQRKADIEALESIVRDGREATPLVKRMLPHLLACAKFVEDHGDFVEAALVHQTWRHHHRGHTSETDPAVPVKAAFAALRHPKPGP